MADALSVFGTFMAASSTPSRSRSPQATPERSLFELQILAEGTACRIHVTELAWESRCGFCASCSARNTHRCRFTCPTNRWPPARHTTNSSAAKHFSISPSAASPSAPPTFSVHSSKMRWHTRPSCSISTHSPARLDHHRIGARGRASSAAHGRRHSRADRQTVPTAPKTLQRRLAAEGRHSPH